MKLEDVLNAIEAEPELDDSMPDEMFEALTKDKATAELALRFLVKQTKENIKKRIVEMAETSIEKNGPIF